MEPVKLQGPVQEKFSWLWGTSIVSAGQSVNNGLPDQTKVQNGWDQYRKKIGIDHQGKALKEGCL